MQTLNVANRLHANPNQPPLHAKTVLTRGGEEIPVAHPDVTRALVALMDMQAVLGGAASHYGGPAAFAEIMSAVHGLMFHEAQKKAKSWHEMFHFVNDAGHCENGIYALKANYQVAGLSYQALRGFRSLQSNLTGHGEAHLFPESVYISNGPLGSGLPQAQGLAAAESLQKTPRMTITAISDGACMEGEAKEALAAIPGLASQGKLGPFMCLVSDNNTKLSGRIDADSFSMTPSFESLQKLGWKLVKIGNGHDLQNVFATIETAYLELLQYPKQPQLLWFKTVKGKGVKSTEESASGGHGFPLKTPQDLPAFLSEIFAGKDLPVEIQSWCDELQSQRAATDSRARWPGKRVKVQQGVSEALIEKASQGLPILSVSADLQGSTGVADFRKKFPGSSFEVGVAESNMVSMAIGLSKQGYIPVVDTFAQFGVTKGALPLIMSGLSEGPIIAMYSHTGFQDAADGASHQALTYLSMVAAIPNVDAYALTSAHEAKALVSQAVENFAQARAKGEVPRSSLFFLGRENYPETFASDLRYELGQPQVISNELKKTGKNVCLLAPGSMLENALLAQKELASAGIGSIVINPSVLNSFAVDFYQAWLKQSGGHVVTVEDHRLMGGFGALFSHAMCQAGVPVKLASLGVGDHFGRSAYSSDDLYELYGLGVKDIVRASQELFA